MEIKEIDIVLRDVLEYLVLSALFGPDESLIKRDWLLVSMLEIVCCVEAPNDLCDYDLGPLLNIKLIAQIRGLYVQMEEVIGQGLA